MTAKLRRSGLPSYPSAMTSLSTYLPPTVYVDMIRIIIRLYHECEGRIENSVPRITVWHHEACQVMTNGDPEGGIFLSYLHTNNRFFFLLTTVFIYLFVYLFNNKLPELHE